MAKFDKSVLEKYGITGTTEVLYNPSYEVLFNEETKEGLEGFEVGLDLAVHIKGELLGAARHSCFALHHLDGGKGSVGAGALQVDGGAARCGNCRLQTPAFLHRAACGGWYYRSQQAL